jgi:hypothetical protein
MTIRRFDVVCMRMIAIQSMNGLRCLPADNVPLPDGVRADAVLVYAQSSKTCR